MPEREWWEDDGTYRNVLDNYEPTIPAAAPPAAARSGPPYTTANPPPYPPDGFEYILNPGTGEFELKPRGTSPPESVNQTPITGGDTPGPITYTGGPAPSFNNSTMPVAGGGGWPTYQAPGMMDPGVFDPGPAFSYKDFSAPDAQGVMKDPGFQFRMDQGRKALEASAAGRGVLRSGGTLKDILGYGQQFASQEYGNVWDRALKEWDSNRQNAFDTWNTGYTGRKDAHGFGADRANSANAFNLNNSQFDFNARQRQAEADLDEVFRRWSQEGNWLRDITVAGAD